MNICDSGKSKKSFSSRKGSHIILKIKPFSMPFEDGKKLLFLQKQEGRVYKGI